MNANIRRACVIVLFGMVPLVQAWAEPAGRILAAAGDVSALRGGQRISLQVGAAVETGDVVTTGSASNAQIRFTDESIVAMRPVTELGIQNYRFSNQPENDAFLLSLLKGGLRTITGVIGRNSRSNYTVVTATSTIGIRGTHYTLVSCAGECQNPDGGTAPNGTYGGVTDGRIAVSNDAGSLEFGRDSFFYVASRTALPQALIGPPEFLRDRLDGQARAKGKPVASVLASASEVSAGDSDSAAILVVVPQAEPVGVAPTAAYTASDPQVISAGSGTSGGGSTGLSFRDPFACTVFPCSGSIALASSWTETTPGGNASGADSEQADFTFTAPLQDVPEFNVTRPVGVTISSSSYTTTPATNVGSASVASIRWERTASTYVENWSNGTVFSATEWDHLMLGEQATLPTSGTFNYNWLGGTSPTDAAGNVGSVSSGGAWAVNFTTRTMGTTAPAQWAVGGVSYTMNVPNQTWSISAPQSATPLGVSGTVTERVVSPLTNVSLSCAPACSLVSSTTYVVPNFYGVNAAALSAAFVTDVTVPAGRVFSTHIQVYGR